MAVSNERERRNKMRTIAEINDWTTMKNLTSAATPQQVASAKAPARNRRASKLVGSDAVVVCGPAKRKAGEPVKCPVCHYYTRIYGACYVCGSITGRRKKESPTERQPTDNDGHEPRAGESPSMPSAE